MKAKMNHTNPNLEKKLQEAVEKGIITPRTENNPYLKYSYKGTGDLVSQKWNIKIYTSGKIVSNDTDIITDIVSGNFSQPDPNLKELQIDDAGWGFPLCGVMIGISDNVQVLTDVVPVSFFQGSSFEKKDYLKNYTIRGIDLLKSFKANPKTHRIKICTGYVNTHLKKTLRQKGYDVRVAEITGMLQDQLEEKFRQHVDKETGLDLAYDPKAMEKNKIGRAFYQVLDFGLNNAPHLLKSGWKSIRDKI
jgi:hypothetical protein